MDMHGRSFSIEDTNMKRIVQMACLLALSAPPLLGADGIRVVSWNITFYDGTRADEIATVCYGRWEGRSLNPDLICLQEMTGRVPTLQFVQAINNAPGSPGDWAAAPIYTDPRGGLHTALVYRTSKFAFVDSELIAPGAGPPQQPRNVVRFDLQPVGYPEEISVISVFPLHYKAGYTDSDLARKLLESQIVRQHIDTLPENRHIILGADLNIQRSDDPAYEELNGIIPNTGVLWDPISTPGNWNNNAAFRTIHTQDPTGGGGMDDRLDQILLSPSLLDGRGMEYDGRFPLAWDLGTTQDQNHSYRAWGNDGTTFNQSLRINGNAMVGPVIAGAIAALADPDGHIPVYLDLDMPGRVRIVGQSQQLGPISFGELHAFVVRIGNEGDTQRWGQNGISPLWYRFVSSADSIQLPTDAYTAHAGEQLSIHHLTLDSTYYAHPGHFTEQIILESDDPTDPESLIEIDFEIVGCNAADLAFPLGEHTFIDVSHFLSAFSSQMPAADIAGPYGVINFFDLSVFLSAYREGC